MTKITRDRLAEKRKYIRLIAPLDMTYSNAKSGRMQNAVTKDISAEGVRFETQDKSLEESNLLEIKLCIGEAVNPVHAKGKIMWKKRLSLEDNAPFDIGVELTEVEEDNKNTFLKFLCDLIYNLREGAKHAKNRA